MLAHALIDPEQRHNLDTLSEDFLQYSTIRFSELLPDAKKGEVIDYSDVAEQDLANYAIEDSDVTLQLWKIFQPKLKESGQAKVFYEIETPLLPVLVAMEREGIRLCETTLATTANLSQGTSQNYRPPFTQSLDVILTSTPQNN